MAEVVIMALLIVPVFRNTVTGRFSKIHAPFAYSDFILKYFFYTSGIGSMSVGSKKKPCLFSGTAFVISVNDKWRRRMSGRL
jgi:hypothetical protein